MRYRPLTHNSEFTRAYMRGKSFVHPHVVLYVNRNRLGHTRVGITASKKIGNAVTRNRARRVIRAALQQTLPPDVGGYDLVFVARGQTPRLKSTQVAKTAAKLLRSAGVLQSTAQNSTQSSVQNAAPDAHQNAAPNGVQNAAPGAGQSAAQSTARSAE